MEEVKKAIKDRESFLEDEAHRYNVVGDMVMHDKRMVELYELKVASRKLEKH